MEKSTIYSLSALANIIEWSIHQLFDDFLFWVKADLWSIKPYKNRYYLDLFEYDWLWAVKTKITWIIRKSKILDTFLDNTNNTLHTITWKEILIQWYVSYSVQWWLSISIIWFSKQYEQWVQQNALQDLVTTLKKKNLYQANKIKTLPLLPKNIALISSETSQWLKDFMSILKDYPYPIVPTLFSAYVEGDKAINSVANALETIEQQQTATECFDCVIILRWWGWSEWFMRQNNEKIVYKVAQASLPVIVAIWHTNDRSLLDEIAYRSCKTPSEAATMLLEKYSYIEQKLLNIHTSIGNLVREHYTRLQHNVEKFYTLIKTVSIDNILALWYALLKKEETILWRKALKNLKKWEQIQVETTDKIYTVTIVSQEEK